MSEEPVNSRSERGDRVRLFTLDEANGLIPWVRTTLEQILADRRSLLETQASLERLTPQMRGNGHRHDALHLEEEMERLLGQLASQIHQFEVAGIQLKDVESGIIDFPALHRGRIVLLCWRLGEGPISYWHELTTGFAGRRPITEFEQG